MGDLRSLTIGDLWSMRNAGRLTVERILDAARESVLQSPVGWQMVAAAGPRRGTSVPDSTTGPPRGTREPPRIPGRLRLFAAGGAWGRVPRWDRVRSVGDAELQAADVNGDGCGDVVTFYRYPNAQIRAFLYSGSCGGLMGHCR